MRIPHALLLVCTVIEGRDGSDSLFELDNSTITGLFLGTNSDALLVTQISSVSLFNLNWDVTLRPERIGRFAATPDSSSYLTVAHVINDTHFVYCGEFWCR